MKNKLYISDFSPVTDDMNFSITIPPVCDRESLFFAYNEMAQFPYFGNNWDSLAELVKDFFWIKQFNIHIYHKSIALLSDDELTIYLRIIDMAREWWEQYLELKLSRLVEWLKKENSLEFSQIWEWWNATPEHKLHLYFNNKDKERIERMNTGDHPAR